MYIYLLNKCPKGINRTYMQFELKPKLFLYPLLAFCLCVSTCIHAQDTFTYDKPFFKGSTLTGKFSHDLFLLKRDFAVHQRKGNDAASFHAPAPLFRVAEGEVAVELFMEQESEERAQSLIQLEAWGFRVTGQQVHVIEGWIPLTQLELLQTLSACRWIKPMSEPYTRSGTVVSQGDSAQASNLLRRNTGLTGSGIRIGILSDSYNILGTASAGVQSNDLPGLQNTNGYTTPVQVLEEGPLSRSDEGRAMAEIIHDVAPGAELYFHSAFNGKANFAQGIRDLEAIGCDVIVDDVGYLDQPFFQDDAISQAVNEVSNRGVFYVSAAGNTGTRSYETAFDSGNPVNINGIVYSPHVFAGTDITQELSIPDGSSMTIVFQWDAPAFSVSGSPGAGTDMDIFLIGAGASVQALSIDNNIGNDAVEILQYQNNTGSTQNLSVLLGKFSGPDPTHVKYIIFESSFQVSIEEYATESGTCYGHPNAEQALAVGAAFYANIPAYTPSLPNATLEHFSSRGGVGIMFDPSGNSISPLIRNKPAIVAPDGGNTTFFVPLGASLAATDIDADLLPNFFGTSAAAPHVAGLASLLWEAQPLTPPTTLKAAIETSANDMLAPGFDFDSGNGWIDAEAAFLAMNALLPVEWIGFDAKVRQDEVWLSWQTTLERGVEGYYVEQGTSPVSLSAVAFVPYKDPASEVNSYQYQVSGLDNGTHYFRIRQTDLGGGESFSDLLTIEIDGDTHFGVYFDTQSRALHVLPNSQEVALMSVEVLDIQGRTVSLLQQVPSTNSIQFPLQSLTHGLYIARLNFMQGRQQKTLNYKFILSK